MLEALPVAFSFLATYALIPPWMSLAKRLKLTTRDHSRPGKPLMVDSAGVAVVLGFFASMLSYAGLELAGLVQPFRLTPLFALVSSGLIAAFLGFVFVDKVKGYRLGLKKWQKPLLLVLAALPLMALSPAHPVSLPFIGGVDFGLFYSLLLVPLGVVGASNAYNTFAGYNGLEAGMGAVIFSTLGLLLLWQPPLSIACFSIAAALMAFLRFNWFPAKALTGDALTYFLGTMLAGVAILGRVEFVAFFLFLPYVADFAVYLKHFKYRVKRMLWRGVARDGLLYPPRMGPIHLIHYPLKWFNGLREYEAVSIFLAVEVVLAVLAVLVVAPAL